MSLKQERRTTIYQKPLIKIRQRKKCIIASKFPRLVYFVVYFVFELRELIARVLLDNNSDI